MSCFGDIKEMFRRAIVITRSHWNSRATTPGIPNEVATAVAKRKYEVAYPSNRNWYSIDPFINGTSLLNVGLSATANTLLLTSSSIFTALAASVITFGGYVIGSGQIAIEEYLVQIGIISLCAMTGLISAIGLRKIDQLVTMRKCLNATEEELKDPEIFHQERCLLKMETEIVENQRQIAEYWKIAKPLERDINVLLRVCRDTEDVPSINSTEVENDLAPIRAKIMEMTLKLREIKSRISRIRGNSEEILSRILRSQAMAGAIKTATTIADLDSGRLAERIEELNEDSAARLAQAEGDAHSLHEDLLIEVGLVRVELDGGQESVFQIEEDETQGS